MYAYGGKHAGEKTQYHKCVADNSVFVGGIINNLYLDLW